MARIDITPGVWKSDSSTQISPLSSSVNTVATSGALTINSGSNTDINLVPLGSGKTVVQGTVSNPLLQLTSTATNDDPNFTVYHARVATTNATHTNLWTLTTAADTTYLVEGRVVARRTGGTAGADNDSAAYVIRGAFNNTGGTVSLIGAENEDMFREDAAAWDIDLEVDGSNVIELAVDGVVDNNITWHATVFVQSMSQ